MSAVKSFLQILSVFALFMAGISPACAFTSGKGFLQICKDDGSVVVMIVSPHMDPYFDAAFNPDAPRTNPTLEMPECSFCFAAGHMPATTTDDMFIAPVVALHNNQFYVDAHPVHWINPSLFDARGPPSFRV